MHQCLCVVSKVSDDDGVAFVCSIELGADESYNMERCGPIPIACDIERLCKLDNSRDNRALFVSLHCPSLIMGK